MREKLKTSSESCRSHDRKPDRKKEVQIIPRSETERRSEILEQKKSLKYASGILVALTRIFSF